MKIGIIGIGNIGNAIRNLLCKNGYEKSLILSDLKNFDNMNFAKMNSSNDETIEKSDVLFLCVQPDEINSIISDINNSKTRNMSPYSPEKIIISCVTGIDINKLETNLVSKHPIIRCVPNLPISLGKGVICFTNNNLVTDNLIGEFYSICKGPLIHKVKKESLINASTILTGSMPAFISFFCEEFIEFGCSKGFTYEESQKLFISTLTGTMEMLKTTITDDIITSVSSPNSCTEKGLNFLQYSGIRSVIYSSLTTSYNSIKNKKD